MARSIVNQGLYLQKEVTPGTALTNAMKRYMGISGTIGWDIQKEYFRGQGYKAITAENTLTELGTANLKVIQDYNALLPLLAGAFGPPVTTPLDAGPPAAYQHVFSINPKAADTIAAFTAAWGDTVRALQASYLIFHGLTLGFQRTQLSAQANAILRAPTVVASVPTSGVTEVPSIPVRASTFNGYLDTAWADLGDTQLPALYATEVGFGDKYSPDWVLNRSFASFSELLENEEIDYTQSLSIAFDATAQAQVEAALDGEMVFVRTESVGADINGTDNYGLTIDTAVRLVPTSVEKSPVSAATVAMFNGTLEVDAVSGKFAEVTLINTLASL